MKRYLLLILLALLLGCPDGTLPLEKSVSINGREYLLLVNTSPPEPVAGEPFSLKISVLDAALGENPAHLTYEVEIADSSGRRVFVESFHSMKGAPYVRSLSLGEGRYTLTLRVRQGMPADFSTSQGCRGITEIYTVRAGFRVRGLH